MSDRAGPPMNEAEPPVSSTTDEPPGAATPHPPGVEAILKSRAFLIGTGLLLLWGVSLPLGTPCSACATPVDGTTWGRIKNTYE